MSTRRERTRTGTAQVRPVLGVHLHGRREEISAEALQKIASSLMDLLNASSRALLPDDKSEPQWVIRDLRLGSVTTEFEPRQDSLESGEILIGNLNEGFQSLLSDGQAPDSWTNEMLRALRKVSQLQSVEGATRVEFWFGDQSKSVDVDATFDQIVSKTLESATKFSMGSVTGHIVGWKDRDGIDELTIRDEVTRSSVRLRALADSGLTIQEFANARIRAWGELQRDRDGKKSVLKMHGFERLPEREPVTFESIQGLWADDDARIDSVSFQRRLRDEE